MAVPEAQAPAQQPNPAGNLLAEAQAALALAAQDAQPLVNAIIPQLPHYYDAVTIYRELRGLELANVGNGNWASRYAHVGLQVFGHLTPQQATAPEINNHIHPQNAQILPDIIRDLVPAVTFPEQPAAGPGMH